MHAAYQELYSLDIVTVVQGLIQSLDRPEQYGSQRGFPLQHRQEYLQQTNYVASQDRGLPQLVTTFQAAASGSCNVLQAPGSLPLDDEGNGRWHRVAHRAVQAH